jgi:hypothetical protein
MKIAIIGAGWLGCHLAHKLKFEHDIKLYEKNEIFSGTSYYNQNRLHKGFHYSRNQTTRKLCHDTFKLFIRDYAHLLTDIPDNYYLIPSNTSIIDFGTFKSIFQHEKISFKESKFDILSNIEGGVIVDEKYIDPALAKEFFTNELNSLIIKQDVSIDMLNIIAAENDLVINVTNNCIHPLPEHYYELSLSLVYTKLVDLTFGAITMVDGPLFSIYPYHDLDYTVTDVQHTPLYISDSISDVHLFRNSITDEYIDNIKTKIEDKVQFYYKDFKEHFKYNKYYTSIKVKKITESADRTPSIHKDKNIITCVTGKIQGIYTLENFIKNEIINR